MDSVAAAQAQQARQELQRVQQEWQAKLQSEVSLLHQRATASMGSTTAQHEQAFSAQQAKHAQQVQTLTLESTGLSQAKQRLQAKVQQTEQTLHQTQAQVAALESSVQTQQQEALHAAHSMTREHESARLSQEAKHRAEIVMLREQQQLAEQGMQQELLQREQHADQNYSELLGRHGMLERRFDARWETGFHMLSV